jgi:hypothetical protein
MPFHAFRLTDSIFAEIAAQQDAIGNKYTQSLCHIEPLEKHTLSRPGTQFQQKV